MISENPVLGDSLDISALDAKSRAPRRNGLGISMRMTRPKVFCSVVVVVVILLAVTYLCWPIIRIVVYGRGYGARERIRDQLADVLAGRRRLIIISNPNVEFATDEFVRGAMGLAGVDFDLRVTDTRGTDDFLAQLRGLPGVRKIELEQTDVTDVGLSHLATLPELEMLHLKSDFATSHITNEGIVALAAAPRLKELSIAPRGTDRVSVSTILALPQLRSLTLYESYPQKWLEPAIGELGGAKGLVELRLVGVRPPAKALEELKDRLRECRVEVLDHW